MKNNKTLIIVILAIIAIIVLVALTEKKEEPKKEEPKQVEPVKEVEKITITFDADGGEEVEKVTIEKDTELELPSTTKEGYTFLGWYKEDTKIEDKTKFSEDTTLKAKWEKIKENAKTMKITFHSNGGSSVSPITMDCSKAVSFPKEPTREGYTFENWVTKKGKVVKNGSKLTCENIDLYADWKKNEEPKKEEKKEEPKKTYSCPDGYSLNGTKCSIEEKAKEKCDGNRKYEYNDKCVTITYSDRKDYDKACKQEHVTYMSFAGYVDGTVINWGRSGCAYYKTNDTSKETCESHGFTWVNGTPGPACYVKWVGGSTINSCKSGYADISNPNTYEGVNGLNGGCFPISEKTKYCDKEGYTLTSGKCVKTIDAELK